MLFHARSKGAKNVCVICGYSSLLLYLLLASLRESFALKTFG